MTDADRPALSRLTLYVIRHGETEDNVAGRSSGQNDSPLTARGRQQAMANGQVLKAVAGSLDGFDFFASPLHRACVTMEIVRGVLGLAPENYARDRRLMECDFGRWTGHIWNDLAHTNPEEFSARLADKWCFRIPGGESQEQLSARVGAFLATLTRDTVIVCHAGSARMIRQHVLGLTPEETVRYTPSNAGVVRYAGGTEARFGE
jgi:broad specificity phosphatase PhoE